MEIKGTDYRVWFDEASTTVFFDGIFRLSSQEYSDIGQFMDQVLEKELKQIKLDLTALNFLNSSGINMLAKFVITVRKKGEVGLTVLGSQKIPWQGKSLPNLKKLYPALELTIQ